MASSPELAARVRAVHRCFPSGVAVVTTVSEGAPYGLAVNAFSSVSMEPLLVLVCVKTSAQTHPHLYAGDHLGINFLAHGQRALAERFATSGGEKFLDVAWSAGATGVPVLAGVSAHLEVQVQQRLAAGTHTIFLGEVAEADAPAHPPLVYFDGGFYDGDRLEATA
ncbi:MAG TPA: flavin reductase family protein [Solirubrobacteraceae bacterium]|nr:flavin reductase family protein [Solirubrobacteraceae bacterium]